MYLFPQLQIKTMKAMSIFNKKKNNTVDHICILVSLSMKSRSDLKTVEEKKNSFVRAFHVYLFKLK